jgi:hypothetical protein
MSYWYALYYLWLYTIYNEIFKKNYSEEEIGFKHEDLEGGTKS